MSVHRTKEFIEDIEPVELYTDANFDELLVNSLSIIRGKSKQIDCFYLARQYPRPPLYNIPNAYEWFTSYNWFPTIALSIMCLKIILF